MARSIRSLLAGVLVATVAMAGLVGTAKADGSQTPVTTGCPSGYDRLSVAWFEATGPYILPRQVDTSGNNNGFVCAHVRPDSVRDAYCAQEIRDGLEGNACRLEQLGLPIYLFTDDDSPAGPNP
jgi:hypothetical protein